MREILFRGKNSMNGNWVYGSLYSGENYMILPVKKPPVVVYEKSLGQFTGLFDKNKNKIFEGDIITKRWKVIVYWSKPRLQFMISFLNNPATNKARPLNEFINQRKLAVNGGDSEIEIIGNIHDNPELLNK